MLAAPSALVALLPLTGGSLALVSLAIILAVVSAIWAGFEMALSSLRDHHVSGLAAGDQRLRATLRLLLRRPWHHEIRVLLLASTAHLAALVLGVAALARQAETLAASFPAWVAGIFTLFIGIDVFAKLGALSHPVWIFRTFSPAFLALTTCLKPLADGLEAWTRAVERTLPSSVHRRSRSGYTEDDFDALIAIQREEGTLNAEESLVIAEIVKLGDRTVKECMTSRVSAFLLPADLEHATMLERIRDAGRWKVPLYRESPDTIVGILDAPAALLHPERPIEAATSPPLFVPATMPALNAFRDFLARPHSIVVVLDEFGATEGVLTHEDIIREVAGDLSTPGQSPRDGIPAPEMVHLSPDRLIVTGTTRVEDVAKELGVTLPSGEADTIGGLVFMQLGYLPLPGERTTAGPCRVIIRKTGGNRIEELIVERNPG